MARADLQGAGGAQGQAQDPSVHESRQVFSAESGHSITLPDHALVTNADMVREGADLVLRAPDGSEVVIEGYFNADPAPMILGPEGACLTPALVQAFSHGAEPVQYAQATPSASDESPVGRVESLQGQATVTHPDGTKEALAEGASIHQGDVIETSADGAVNIVFIDETSFAVSRNAKLAIDQYVYNPSTESGETNFSMLRGLFVFTSGLIGRDDPDHVKIDTPRGSIGIRGTIIAGDADAGTVTVVEGAIVVHSLMGQEVTLSGQFETAQFALHGTNVENVGVRPSSDVSSQFGTLSGVLPTFFNTLDHSDSNVPSVPGSEGGEQGQQQQQQQQDGTSGESLQDQPPAPQEPPVALPPVPLPTFLQGMDSVPVYMSEPAPLTTTNIVTMPLGGGETTALGGTSTTPSTTTSSSTTTGTTTTTTGTVSGGGTVTLVPLVLDIQSRGIPYDIASGDVIGVVKTTASFSNVAFSLATDGPFRLVMTATDRAAIVYVGGAVLATGDTFHFDIVAKLPDGRSASQGFVQNVVVPLEPLLDISTSTNGVHLISSGYGAGVSIAGIGDTDHDGLKEIGFIDQGGTTGKVQIMEWSTSGFAVLTNIATYVGGPAPDIYEDMILTGLGDVNGDGKDDYAVGSPASDPGSAPYAGDLTIFSGAAPATSPVTLYAGASSVDGGEGYGTGVAGVGDVNNDGIADVLISAPYEDGGVAVSGVAWLMFGNPNFFAGGGFDPTNVAPGLMISGVSSYDRLGESVASAGDFNHDGINDFIIGAPGVDVDADLDSEGAAYVLFGQDGTGWSTGYNLSTGGNYLKITGVNLATGSDLGGFVSGIGDFNGDGKSDIVVAATQDHLSGGSGDVYVIFGGQGVGTLDVSTLNGTNGFTIHGANSEGLSILGGAPVGDFNGDGRDDFAVIFGDDTGNNDIYVVYGKSGTMPSSLSLTDLQNSSVAFHMVWDGQDGETINISAAGDVNGDGRDDILIGSDAADTGSVTGLGAVYLVAGREAAGAPATSQLSAAGTLLATAAGQSLVGTTGVDILNAGLAGVSMRAGASNDTLLVGNSGLRLADGGAGNDTLGLVTVGMTLDFSQTGSAQISNIERINFQANSQTLKLGIEDIFQLLHDSADGTLRISRDTLVTGSTLQIEDNLSSTPGNLTDLGFTTGSAGSYGDTVTYNAYTNGTYTLLVDQTITNVSVI